MTYMYCDLVYNEILFSVNESFAVANPPQLEGQTTTRADINPTGPKQKCSPPMTHDLANDDKQACMQYKEFLSNVKKYKFRRAF